MSLLASAALGSCASEAAPADPGRPGSPIEVAETPELTLGVVSGDAAQEFDRVVTPFRTGGGRIVVPVGGDETIRVFSADGALVTTLGGDGEGPGEFRDLMAAWPRGDTIEAFDARLSRINRFLPDGSVEVVTLRSGIPDLSWVAGPATGGWFLGGVESAGANRRDSMAVFLFGRDGSPAREVARAAGFARYEAEGFRGPEPLSPRGIARIHDGLLYVAQSELPRLRVVDSSGSLVREITWEPEGAAPPAAAFRAVLDSAAVRASPELAADLRRRLEAAPVPETLSVLWDFLVDEEGFVWIRPYEPLLHAAALGGLSRGGGGGRWIVLTPDGVEAARVDVPAGLDPVQITADVLVGVHRDALGVETVRVHTVRRR